MSEWKLGKEEDYYDWYYKKVYFNGTQYRLSIWPYPEIKSIRLWVGMSSGNKRKHVDSGTHDNVGRLGGIKALVWIKKQVLEFPDFYIKDAHLKKGVKLFVCVGWEDNRRRNIYHRALKDEGFRFAIEEGKKILMKRIIVT